MFVFVSVSELDKDLSSSAAEGGGESKDERTSPELEAHLLVAAIESCYI